MENGIKQLGEAKLAQEEKNMELQESLGKVLGTSVERRNQAKKKEIKQMKELLALIRPGRRQITLALSLPEHLQQADRELHASLSLGELCRQLQNKI